ncbi:MAG: DUF2089 family protein [Bacilli bacterium]|nr:DUF2089 family protein [Bacillales bacterium]
MLNLNEIPSWLINLELEDINFIKKFILYSGSLKDLAKDYDITYPTMRIRLDKLIEKIKMYDDSNIDPYIEKIKILALDNKIDLDTAKSLINEYRKVRKKYDNR